jgi:CP family cyanate transporter-like MFS transporter
LEARPAIPAPAEEAAAPRTTARAVVSWTLVAALCVAALNLRPAVTSISPLLNVIRDDVHINRTLAGLLTTIPTLCIGVGAFRVPARGARIGGERALAGAIGVIGVATVGRLWAGNVAVLFATTLLVGVGIAAAQTLLPGLVRTHFAERRMMITTLYSLGITLGALIPAAATAPVRDATGSWETALACWAVFALVALVALGPIARRSRPATTRGLVSPPWRLRRAWEIALFFGGASGLFFVIVAWLAPVYEDHGWSPTHAGLLLTLMTVAQAVGTLALSTRAARMHDRRPVLIGSLVLLAVGLAGVAVAPFSVPVLWAILLGLGNGLVFPAMLVLPVDYASDPAMVARLAGMGFGIGYLLASLGPVVAGALRDTTGTYAAPFGLYAAICVLLMLLSLRFVPQPHHEQWPR